jgi:hypothetical protein
MRVAPGMQLESRTPKMRASIRHLALVVGAAALVAVGAGCSLNPQPLPPGDGPEGGGGAAQPEVDAAAGGGADSGTLLGANDGGSSDGTTPAIPPPDGATDAAVLDGASDAPADGQPSSDGATEE